VTDVTASALADALRDRYTIERELGRGGMATVYLARDLKHDRLVAFKLLRPDLAAILGAERFIREIQLTAGLQHPHILPLLDSGSVGGFLFYVMPYVEGESLRQRLEQAGQLPLEEALAIARDVGAALDYAHGLGVIHRDVKPENILLYRSEPMVADFGIALAASSAGRERLTETGLSLGTPAYMSPEQASASPKLDARSDQYSLACVVYEMLAGEPPYTGPTAQAIIAKRLSEPVPHLSTVRAVPGSVELAVTRALAKSPADRFPSVAAFVAALEHRERGRRVSPRMAALVGGATVLAAVLLLAFQLRPHSAVTPNVSRQVTFTGRANEPALSPDGKSVVYVSTNQSLAEQRLDGGDPVVLVPPSRWVFAPRWTDDGTAILFCMMPDSSRLAATWMIPSGGGPAREVLPDIDAFDAGPDSTTALLSQRETHQILVMDLRSGRSRQSVRIPDSLGVVQDLDWSPDQRWVVFEARGIWVAPLGPGAQVRLSATGKIPRWSPTGDAVYFLDGPRGTTALKKIRMDLKTGRPRGEPQRVLGLPTADRFSIGAEGVLVHNQVSISSQAAALRYSGKTPPHTVEQTRPLTEGTGLVNSLAISDDGRQVAVSRGQGEESAIVVIPFEGGPGRVVAGSPAQELAPSWSPDGARLAFIRADSGGTRLMVADYPDGTPRRIGSASPIQGATSALFWSADGRWLAYRVADLRRIGLVNIGRQQESFVTIPDSLGSGYGGGGLVSPDGGQVVINTIHRWNDWGELWLVAADGRVLSRIKEPFGESYPVRWTDDGWLYVINNHAEFSDQGQFRIQLWRMRMPDGAPEFYAPIPEGCGALSLSRDALSAACEFYSRQSDLVAVTGFDPDAARTSR
jgi:serine/threonine protein kinase/dipeptidyl aminopeptidase/acylaminoacyl peptidase